MKKFSKAITIVTGSFLCFVVVAMVYSSARGYMAWFFRIRHPIITVKRNTQKDGSTRPATGMSYSSPNKARDGQ
jgi:hypothetical protein